MPPARVSLPVLREFELMVLLAVLTLGDQAYALAVGDAIEQRTGRKASRSAVQVTLERLEDKGLVTSHYSDPTPVRGGRSKRLFVAKPLAIAATREALDRIEAMSTGLESVLKPRS